MPPRKAPQPPHPGMAGDTPRPATLADLAVGGIDVFCWCNGCGHNAVITTAGLLGRFRESAAVPRLGARMRCSRCGARDVETRPAWPSPGLVTRHT